jgi:hypothetical protein
MSGGEFVCKWRCLQKFICSSNQETATVTGCFVAGCFMLGLPETHGLPLPETIADAVRSTHHSSTATPDHVFVIDASEEDSTGHPQDEM